MLVIKVLFCILWSLNLNFDNANNNNIYFLFLYKSTVVFYYYCRLFVATWYTVRNEYKVNSKNRASDFFSSFDKLKSHFDPGSLKITKITDTKLSTKTILKYQYVPVTVRSMVGLPHHWLVLPPLFKLISQLCRDASASLGIRSFFCRDWIFNSLLFSQNLKNRAVNLLFMDTEFGNWRHWYLFQNHPYFWHTKYDTILEPWNFCLS